MLAFLSLLRPALLPFAIRAAWVVNVWAHSSENPGGIRRYKRDKERDKKRDEYLHAQQIAPIA
jgi:hypothetical protein